MKEKKNEKHSNNIDLSSLQTKLGTLNSWSALKKKVKEKEKEETEM